MQIRQYFPTIDPKKKYLKKKKQTKNCFLKDILNAQEISYSNFKTILATNEQYT